MKVRDRLKPRARPSADGELAASEAGGKKVTPAAVREWRRSFAKIKTVTQ